MKPEHNYAHNLFCPLVNFEQILQFERTEDHANALWNILLYDYSHSQLNKAF